ncbi:hypothetical protein HK104_005614 [Borealophlyctis nickersoniae]|nr:hypothetical protein HK104_005614 [Borealophlyctis nickersoniae]
MAMDKVPNKSNDDESMVNKTKKPTKALNDGAVKKTKKPRAKKVNKITDDDEINNGLRELFEGDALDTVNKWAALVDLEIRRDSTGNPFEVFRDRYLVDKSLQRLEKGALPKEEQKQVDKNDITRFRNIYILVYGIKDGNVTLPGLGLKAVASNIYSTKLRNLSFDSVWQILAVNEVSPALTQHGDMVTKVEDLIAEKMGLEKELAPFDISWAKVPGGGGGKRKAKGGESQSKKPRSA